MKTEFSVFIKMTCLMHNGFELLSGMRFLESLPNAIPVSTKPTPLFLRFSSEPLQRFYLVVKDPLPKDNGFCTLIYKMIVLSESL